MEQLADPRTAPAVNLPPPALYVTGLAAGAVLQLAWPLTLPGGDLVAFLGWLAAAIGVTFIATAVASMRRARTGIDPRTPATALVTTGPYALTRNPIYLGLAFVYLGVAVSLRLTWGAVLLPLVLLAVDQLVIAREERYLTERFGDEYHHYVAGTRRWLLARWRAS